MTPYLDIVLGVAPGKGKYRKKVKGRGTGEVGGVGGQAVVVHV